MHVATVVANSMFGKQYGGTQYACLPHGVYTHRVTLVELLFASQNAPPLPETDPELRRALLDSLKTFEEQEARRPAFTHEPRVSVPEPASRGVKLAEQLPHHSHAWLSQKHKALQSPLSDICLGLPAICHMQSSEQ